MEKRGRQAQQLVLETVVVNLKPVIACAGLLLACTTAFAQEAGAPPGPPERKNVGDWEVRCFPVSNANPCDMFDHGTTWYKNSYVSHHSPALYFDDIQAHHSSEDVVPSAECRNKMLPAGTTAPNDMSTYNAALASGSVARFNLVVPNNCENGHDLCGGASSLGQFDSFLSREIPKIEASPAFGSNGTIIVTWDEGSDPPLNPKHVVTAVIGPSIKPGVYAGGRFTHYSLLRTLEDGFGINRHLAKAARAKPINQIWK